MFSSWPTAQYNKQKRRDSYHPEVHWTNIILRCHWPSPAICWVVQGSVFSDLNLQFKLTINFKDGVPIQDGLSYDQKTLSISHAKTADSGFYSCRFKNIKGIEEALFSVSVLEPPLGSGIIAGIVIVSIIVLVLLALLIHKILQDKVFFS